jgi:hypothetical protein
LIDDLLDAPEKARIYTKIDLHHTFHLVQVAEGNEWKTTFTVVLGGIGILFPTYLMVFTGKRLSRTYSQFDDAFEHRHAQASDGIGQYLITR